MSSYIPTLLLALGALLVTVVSINGQILLAPAGRPPVSNSCPQAAMISRVQNQSPYLYPMNVLVALEQFNQENNGNVAPADPTPVQPPEPRCKPEASRVFTKLFSIPGAVADSLLSGEIII